MPCFNSHDNDDLVRVEPDDYQALKRCQAVLCAILRSNPNAFESVDWKACGVTESWAYKWWESHQESDRKREERLKQEKAAESEYRKKQAQNALKILTPAELLEIAKGLMKK